MAQHHRHSERTVLAKTGDGHTDPPNLIVECRGEQKRDNGAHVETAKTVWVLAVNNCGGLGLWGGIRKPCKPHFGL